MHVESDIFDAPVGLVESECTSLIIEITHEFELLVEVQVVGPLSTSLVPSIVRPPTLVLRHLLENLKYVYFEDGARLVRQLQRRLNPLILDVAKKEVTSEF
jgi:hypothetical protein